LALHGEVKQQGAQLLDLGTAHHHPIEPVAAGEAVLAEAPLTAEQQFLLLQVQLLLLQPALQGRRQAETGLNHAALGAPAQQASARTALGPTQQGIEGIQQDRFTGTGLAGEHGEALAEAQLQPLDQGDVAEAQSSQHRGGGWRQLRPLLLDLTVQGQTQQLARPGQQRRWLDRFAGETLQPP